MRSIPTRVLLPLLLALAAGCDNELPTVTGESGFPSDQIPATYQLVVPAQDFLLTDTVYEGFRTSVGYLLVARNFDGALNGNALLRFDLPDSVTYVSGGTARSEPIVAYGRSRLSAAVDSASVGSAAEVRLELRPVTQAWDSTAVTWRNAVNRPGSIVPWRTPGGTTAAAVAATTYLRADTATNDSVHFSVDSLTITRLARGEIEGLLVGGLADGTRIELTRFALDLGMRPAGRPDTVVTERITRSRQVFVLNPDPPTDPAFLRVGGINGARSVIRLDLNRTVNTCGPGGVGAGCRQVPLTQVTLDAVSLVLDPVAVPSGYRPLVQTGLTIRRVLEPELGRRAPLGEVLLTQPLPASLFSPGGARPVSVSIAGPVAQAIIAGSSTLDLALTVDVGETDFGTAWFTRNPRLRFIYTVPQRPQLP